jgi:hypothetical protein
MRCFNMGARPPFFSPNPMEAKRKQTSTTEAEVRSVQVGVMLEPSLADRLDALRRVMPKMPTRSTLCRDLIVEGLDRAEKKAR